MCRETPLPHSLHCLSNSFISTCPIHHCRHPKIVIHTLGASSFLPISIDGIIFSSYCKDTSGCNLPTPGTILAARICTPSTDPSCPPPPNTPLPHTSTLIQLTPPLTSQTSLPSPLPPRLYISSTIHLVPWLQPLLFLPSFSNFPNAH